MAYYLYCITKGNVSDFKMNGVDQNSVEVICIKDLSLIVHQCEEKPYQGEDEEVKKWVVEHNNVVERIWEKQGSVLPMTFDVIIKQSKSQNNDLKKWIKNSYNSIKKRLDYFKDLAEYQVHIYIKDVEKMSNINNTSNSNLESLNQNKKGIAYLKQKRKKKRERKQIKDKLNNLKNSYLSQIKNIVTDLVENKSQLNGRKPTLINVSVLATEEESKKLGIYLDKIHNKKNFKVHFSGPWPCYSFTEDLTFYSQG